MFLGFGCHCLLGFVGLWLDHTWYANSGYPIGYAHIGSPQLSTGGLDSRRDLAVMHSMKVDRYIKWHCQPRKTSVKAKHSQLTCLPGESTELEMHQAIVTQLTKDDNLPTCTGTSVYRTHGSQRVPYPHGQGTCTLLCPLIVLYPYMRLYCPFRIWHIYFFDLWVRIWECEFYIWLIVMYSTTCYWVEIIYF
jgi:hypothetical protein